MFQYKLLNNILFLNARLFHLNYVDSPLCSLCNTDPETPIHFFCDCLITISVWNEIINFFSPNLKLDVLTPQSAILGFFDDKDDNAVRSDMLLIFKYTLYKNRTKSMNKYIIINKIKLEKF